MQGQSSPSPWQLLWPLSVDHFFEFVECLDLLCSHDLRAMRMSCRLWNSLCRGFLLDCACGDRALECAAMRSSTGRVQALLLSPGCLPPRFSLWNVCQGSPTCCQDDHLACVKLLLAHDVPANGYSTSGVDMSHHLACLRAVAWHYNWSVGSLASACRGGLGQVPEVGALLMEFSRRDRQVFESYTLRDAVATGSLEYALAVQDKTAGHPEDICDEAAEGGNVEILKMFHDPPKFCCSASGACKAARRGHLEVLQYLASRNSPMNESCCSGATESGRLDCLKYLHQSGIPFSRDCVIRALEAGQPACLRYCLEICARFRDWTLAWTIALRSRDADCLRILVDCGHSQPVSSRDLVRLAESGSLDHLRVLCDLPTSRANAPLHDVDACRAASKSGHLKALRYLHDAGWPWDSTVCLSAAQHGNLLCLKYAHEHGCPWDSCALECAKEFGHATCVRYMKSNGLE